MPTSQPSLPSEQANQQRPSNSALSAQACSAKLKAEPPQPSEAEDDSGPEQSVGPRPVQDKAFSHVVFVPHSVSEAKKAREALARLPTSARLFLDVFAGFHAPVTKAVAALGLDNFQPFDLDADAAFDVLHDPTYELLLQICWSGIVGAALFAPPCKEYSRLKLLPGGPPAPWTACQPC